MTPLLEVSEVCTEFRTKRGIVHAVNEVSFTIDRGEVVGVVGESGSGKSTLARSVIRLVRPPGEVVAGTAMLDGRDLLGMSRTELRQTRGRRVGFVAQNPFGALNPIYRIERQFANIVRAHQKASRAEVAELGTRLLKATGIADPERVLRGYAHELSGGMAQRVVIAMALSLDPSLLIADEPTTALDLTVQRQLLDALQSLIRADGARSMLLVTHDLSVVATYCDRVLVMYAGKVIEQGPTASVFTHPAHPYTAALLQAVPGTGAKPIALRGTVPDLVDYPRGCPYRTRCARASAQCLDEAPVPRTIADDRTVGCHYPIEEPADHAVGVN